MKNDFELIRNNDEEPQPCEGFPIPLINASCPLRPIPSRPTGR